MSKSISIALALRSCVPAKQRERNVAPARRADKVRPDFAFGEHAEARLPLVHEPFRNGRSIGRGELMACDDPEIRMAA